MVFGNWFAALESKSALTTIEIQVVDAFGTFVQSATGAAAEAPAFIERLRDRFRGELRDMVKVGYDQEAITAAWRHDDGSAGEVLAFDCDGRVAITPVQPFNAAAWDRFSDEVLYPAD